MSMENTEKNNPINTLMISAISHDLRTPIATIKGYSTMLADYLPQLSVEETKEYVRSIDNAADRLNRIVANLLDTSQLDAGTLRLEIAATDVAAIVQTAVKEAFTVDEKREIVIDLPRRPAEICADGTRLRQVLDNLIENAGRRSPPGGKIVISLACDDSELTVSITDPGPEIPAGELESFFDFTSNHSSNRGYNGRLSLYVCRRLVEVHGGRITVSSAPSGGATVQFSLPVTPPRSDR